MDALERIAAGDLDGLVVAKLDRLTRSVIDFAMLLEWFTAARATLVRSTSGGHEHARGSGSWRTCSRA